MKLRFFAWFTVTVSAVFIAAIGGCDISEAATAENRFEAQTVQQEKESPESERPLIETSSQPIDQMNRVPKTVRIVPLKAESYTPSLELTGKTLAAKESYLSLGVPGLIDKVFVKRGDRVKKGDLLLRLDRSGYQLGVQQAEAALDGASVATEQLVTEIARVNQLLAEGAAPTATKDDLLAKDKGAKAQRRMAEVAVKQARKALKDSELRAPYDGVITDILKEKGEQAPAMPPTMLMKIMDTDTLEVQVFAPENAARFIKEGAPAEVTIDSVNVTASGEVIFVSDAIQPGARTFEVRIRIDNKDGRIKAGSFARVRLVEETVDKTLTVPLGVLSRDAENRPYVFTVDKGVARKRLIEVGGVVGARVQVTSGLALGDQLIVTNLASLGDGQPVVVEK